MSIPCARLAPHLRRNAEEMKSTTVQREKAPRARNARGEGERLRDEIIAAAIKVLSTIGAEDPFSLRAVAKEAKIAAPSVYIHFADRNVLLLAVLEKLFREQVAIRAAAEEEAARARRRSLGTPSCPLHRGRRVRAEASGALQGAVRGPCGPETQRSPDRRFWPPPSGAFHRIDPRDQANPCQRTGLTRSATAGASLVVGLARSDLASHQQAHIGLAVCHRACRTDHTRRHPAQIAPLTRLTRLGFFLPLLGRARGPHPTSLRSATLPEVGGGIR